MQPESKANHLIKETSPYLLQHAYNPVAWYPWSQEALDKAKKEDKPIILSIGYSSCHWCHVMERECFENETLAALMNRDYISIKVDREERPDVDQIYMDAIQSMGIHGGWPLNVFLTPDQKPFYGGTYFPPNAWKQVLENVKKAFTEQREKIEESADGFVKSLNESELAKFGLTQSQGDFDENQIHALYQVLNKRIDNKKGGTKGAPKFPMPSIWQWLLHYVRWSDHEDAVIQLQLTLDRMAQGGIFDQLKGGFARYSVDDEWFAPHFEKMLYDNGQLLSLYANAYKVFKKPLYKQVIHQTINWLADEMTDASGGFYAALDADSEGVEGKFYTWPYQEVEEVLQDKQTLPLIADYFNLTKNGNWEDGRNILYWNVANDDFAAQHGLSKEKWLNIKDTAVQKLLVERNKRIRPGLDDKVLAGWNGLTLKGLCLAYEATGNEQALILAKNNAAFLRTKMIEYGHLKRSYKNGHSIIDAYLEDYAFVIEGFISLYEVTFEEEWLIEAEKLTDTAVEQFYDSEEGFFYYTGANASSLIARKKEIFDNVIPGSNGAMAHNLHYLGIALDRKDYADLSEDMVKRMLPLLIKEPQYLSHWAILHLKKCIGSREIIIIGNDVTQYASELKSDFIPEAVFMGAKEASTFPLLKDRSAIDGKTTIFVCQNKACQLPVFNTLDAKKQLAQ